jgi:hypothetical protein
MREPKSLVLPLHHRVVFKPYFLPEISPGVKRLALAGEIVKRNSFRFLGFVGGNGMNTAFSSLKRNEFRFTGRTE